MWHLILMIVIEGPPRHIHVIHGDNYASWEECMKASLSNSQHMSVCQPGLVVVIS